MDAELVAIQRVKKAVAGLTEPARFRVLQYVVQGMYETQQNQFRSGENTPISATGTNVPRMSEARPHTN